jgi:DNA-directed RNA polymerase subunit RPC12/RpoP
VNAGIWKKRKKSVNIQDLVQDLQAAACLARQAQDAQLSRRLTEWGDDLSRVMKHGGVEMLQEVTFTCPDCGADLSQEARAYALDYWDQTDRLPWFCDAGCEHCQKIVWFNLEWTLILSQVTSSPSVQAIYTCPRCDGHWHPDDGSPCPRCGGEGVVHGAVCVRCGGAGEDIWDDDYDTCPRCDGSGIEPMQTLWSKHNP